MVKTTRTTHIKSGILYNKLKDVGKIEPYQKKINLNSDKKRNWFSELKSLNDKTKCDSAVIPADIVVNLISNDDIDWFDDEHSEESESNSVPRWCLMYLDMKTHQ